MGCECERSQYNRNLEHMRIVAKNCAEILQQDQIIYKVNGRIPHYEFSSTCKGQYVETVQFDRRITYHPVLSDNEVGRPEPVDLGKPAELDTEQGVITANLERNLGSVLSGGKPKKVQGKIKGSDKSRNIKE